MAKTVFDVLKEQIEERKLSSTEFLISGGPKTLPNIRKSLA
jgi:hypothetical protein